MASRFTMVVAGALSLAGLSGCVVVDRDGGGRDRTVSYRCDDDREFTAQFDGDRADVRARGQTWRLERTGSGEYESDDGDVRLNVGRNQAELRVDDRDYENCEARNSRNDDDEEDNNNPFGGFF